MSYGIKNKIMEQISLPVAMVAVAVLAGITADLEEFYSNSLGWYCFHQNTTEECTRFFGWTLRALLPLPDDQRALVSLNYGL